MLLRISLAALFTVGVCAGPVLAQSTAQKEEVTFLTDIRAVPDLEWQSELRHRNGWRQFKSSHPRWSVEFNEASGMPRRAYGDPIAVGGGDASATALEFLGSLDGFGIPLDELVPMPIAPTKKVTYAHFAQVHEGLTVLGAKALVKLDAQGRVIGFGADVYREFPTDLQPAIGEAAAIAAATAGMLNVVNTSVGGLVFLPVPEGRKVEMRLVREVEVSTGGNVVPGRYRCLVDAHTGKLWYRTNEVKNCGHEAVAEAGADVQMVATAYPGNPMDAPEVQNLPDMDVTIGGSLFRTDINGFVASGVTGPVETVFQLRGRYANVSTNGVTPVFSGTLNEGPNTVSFDGHANIRELSAYIYTNEIHAHVKDVLPAFQGTDFSLPVRVDLTIDNCNANYDGSGLNFFAAGNNCPSMCTLNDVVYHEYGHNVNDKFYNSLSENFSNGAMDEGYADVWALTLTRDPVLGRGFNVTDPNSSVRRYDQDRRVYPVDIQGEVHADGEIICGAWWDTYVLLGNDMELTTELFAAAYPGLQAATANGQEGQSFRDVLLDVLQADDDDGDITNGTPHGDAIVEAFGLHGITLISDVEVIHQDLLTAPAEAPITVGTDILITFPSTEYLTAVTLFYKVNDQSEWTEQPMSGLDVSYYETTIPAQPAGTIVSYYLALTDIFGQASSVTPTGAERPDPNLPFHIFVGYEVRAAENADDRSELGQWTQGLPTDNAVTGDWEFGTPIPSYSDVLDASTIVQTGTQHTENGEFCWFTGNAADATSPVGDRDVDDGTTTLLSATIDLSAYENPAFSYWRWYVNNPPTGANPSADWWQVYASGDGGDSWVPVEDTKSSERRWRRMAFRVQDVLGDVSSIRLKFNASDSIRPGVELEGGSLVEAALDDIELWDEVETGNGLDELGRLEITSMWPVPANESIMLTVSDRTVRGMGLEVLDLTGRRVLQPVPAVLGSGTQRVDVRSLAVGQYVLRLRWDGGSIERRFSIVR
ncbi:MAG: hypothetical protein JNL43_01205 [Flavobacteriales bacterium]|nr:hypothetical protein [Flavobacteriales bacterium]